MKTNITPELKAAIEQSIERSKSIVIKPFTPYVSKPEPTRSRSEAFKAGVLALGRSLKSC